MGKDKFTVNDSSPGVRRNISRRDFQDAIETAISEAERNSMGVIPVEDIRREAATATQMDALAWHCDGSCGCPMVKVGVVVFNENAESSREPHGAPMAFASAYDRAIKDKLGHTLGGIGGSATILNIID